MAAVQQPHDDIREHVLAELQAKYQSGKKPLTSEEISLYVAVRHAMTTEDLVRKIDELTSEARKGFQSLTGAVERQAASQGNLVTMMADIKGQVAELNSNFHKYFELEKRKVKRLPMVGLIAALGVAAGMAFTKWGWDLLKLLIVKN